MDEFKTVVMNPVIYRYLYEQCQPPSPVQAELIDRTAQLGTCAEMQIPHEQGLFLTLLARLLDARCIVEVGTFTGYSTLCLAQGLGAGGRVITCDLSVEWISIAENAWREAGVSDQIEVRIGPAQKTLSVLPADPVDLVFLDADKTGYIDYWEQLLPAVRPGGLILADNVLYAGEAADPRAVGNAAAIRAFNDHVRSDNRVESLMLPIADGLTISRKVAFNRD